MTSLGNKPLQQAKPESRWGEYLPIDPAKPHPVSGSLLNLENPKSKRGMTENSHISLRGVGRLEGD